MLTATLLSSTIWSLSLLYDFDAHHQKELMMLVLTRKKGEGIVIGDSIVLTVVEIRGDKIRLGIEAPKNVSIHRQEIYATIQEGKP